MKNIEIIDEKVYYGSQSVNYELIGKLKDGGNHRLIKVSIKKDSVNFQSFANLYVWSGDQWNKVNFIHHTQMQTIVGPYTQGAKTTDFHKDRDSLINISKQIIL